MKKQPKYSPEVIERADTFEVRLGSRRCFVARNQVFPERDAPQARHQLQHDVGKCLGGGEIEEVIQQVRGQVAPGATITMSIGTDSALEGDAFEVDIFAFGQFDDAELAGQGDGGADAMPDAGDYPGTAQGEDSFRDPLYPAARSLVLQHRRASISLVQRHLRIGYGRASGSWTAWKAT